ncbi:hypothetical protein CsSME_00051132 [Camellia sinensis var. sinensis]
MANKTQRRNLVSVEDPGLVRQEVLRHFSKVFYEKGKSRPKLLGNFVSVSRSKEVEILEVEFTMDEIWEAMKDCDGNKAPGPDGFNMTCIQKCWKFMNNDVFQFNSHTEEDVS